MPYRMSIADIKIAMKILILCAMIVGTIASATTPSTAQNAAPPTIKSILDANDAMSRHIIQETTATGNMKDRLHAEAWVVIASVALGMGRQFCYFPNVGATKFIMMPSLDSMSEDDIYEMNRVVTSNYRNAERNGRVVLDRLFPATRQVVLSLSDGRGRWNCREISNVWQAAYDYLDKQKN